LPATLVAAAVLAGVAHAQGALQGIDVSHYQGTIGWVYVAGAGEDFVFAKASEGTTLTDATYPLNRSGAGLVGIHVGAYHFARPGGSSDVAATANAIAQADSFLAAAQPGPGDLRPALDLEKTGGLLPARLTTWTQAWLDEISARLGVKPIIYASPNFWGAALADTPLFATGGYPLWIAHWTKATLPILPGAGWGGLGWTFWQWTNCIHVTGIAPCVDGDRFNGTRLGAVTIPAFPSGPPASDTPPAILGTPEAGRLLAAVPGRWSGGKPVSFSYQWQSCDAAGAGCLPIAGAYRETYKPTAREVGHALVVSVTAQTATASAAAVSPPTLAVAGSGAPSAAAPRAISPPTIEGVAEVGQTLFAQVGTWTGQPSLFSYQWRSCAGNSRSCTVIPGASGSTYTVTPGDIGTRLALVVTATGSGGSRSATAAATAIVVAAPLPAPAIGRAVAQPGQAGAVTSASGSATVTWQPGAVPAGAVVGLADSGSRLALRGTALRLRVGATTPLPWPVDVAYASAPSDAIAGFLAGKGTWQPVAQLPAAKLPSGQTAGAYRDAANVFHVLARAPGRIALFAPGGWGDPRLVSAARPTLTLVRELAHRAQPGGTVGLSSRLSLDSQAHVYVYVLDSKGHRLLLRPRGSRIGSPLHGRPTTHLQALQLRPGTLPIRVLVPRGQLQTNARYKLRIVAVDPYGRHSQLVIPFGR
jgi:GH25 family lysozyme M1 (1,4-beta-N-acetylmuramidase)